jgi:pSer/pThr/pTyr-binding forkhead associated (FHA) protein
MSSFWLQVTEPGHPARVVTVDGELEIGRDSAGLLVDDPTVSRRHLLLDASDGVLLCVDAGSANGTYVNGTRVDDPVHLTAGDVIRIGETELVVHEGREVAHAAEGRDGEVVIEVLDRPSEAIRELRSATLRGPRRG